MKKTGLMLHGILLSLHLAWSFSNSNAQGYYYYDDRHYEGAVLAELAIKGGMMNALTDIGGKPGDHRNGLKDLNLSFSRPCISVHASLLYQNKIGFRIQYTAGKITAADSILEKERTRTHGRYERHLSFQSPVREFGLLLEVHPLLFFNTDKTEKRSSRLSPYLLAGTGFFTYNPQAEWKGRWYSLQPLRTEGQGFSMYADRKPYSLQQQNFLAGAGIRYEINAWLNGHIELLHRFLKTDYLDDVSQDSYVPPAYFARELPAAIAGLARTMADRRAEVDPGHTTNPGYQRGNPSDNDAYFSLEIGLAIVLGRTRR